MTQKAIEVLAAGSQLFILMGEGASIDKQSHPNQAAGTIWDTIEFDKAVGVGRTLAAKRAVKDTLLIFTADHDHSMHFIGWSNTPDWKDFARAERTKIASHAPRGHHV